MMMIFSLFSEKKKKKKKKEKTCLMKPAPGPDDVDTGRTRTTQPTTVPWLTRLPLPVHTLLCQHLNVPSLWALR